VNSISIAPSLPSQWSEIRFRYVASTSKGRLPVKEDDEVVVGDFLPYLSMEYLRGDANASHYVPSQGMVTAEDQDVLLLWDGSNAGEFLRAKRGAVSSTAALVSPLRFDRNFLFWLCKAAEPVLKTFTNGMGIPHVDGEFLKNLALPYPTNLVDQSRIANYLDREIARIDGLIAEKGRMLALLEEKRATLISRAVTRGLNPNVPLKSSGIDWLGDIPAHWEVQPIKYLATVGNGSTPSVENVNYWSDDGYPWLNSSVVNESPIRNASRFVTDLALRECHLPKIQPPAVLVGITGQGKTRGMASVLGIETTINQHLAFIKPRNEALQIDYLCFILEHAYAFLRSDSDGAGSTKGAITCEQLANMKIPTPPHGEQMEICSRIRQSLDVSVPIRSEIQSSINLLKERRSALITAAVTGQIPIEAMRP
jgi:type I restriction enzyme S subunit